MQITESKRGFQEIRHKIYPAGTENLDDRIVCESSAIGSYKNSFDKPGSSYLWIGQNHFLNREEVKQLVDYLNQWLRTGSFNASS